MKGGCIMAKNRISMLRKQLRISQRELGERLGVGQTAVSAWENGRNEPDIETMNTIAQLFGVSFGYLAGYEKDEPVRDLTYKQIGDIEEHELKEYYTPHVEIEDDKYSGLSKSGDNDLKYQKLIDRWNKSDPNHNMYFEAFQFNELCDDMNQSQREAMLAAARAVFKAVHDKK